MPTHPLKLENPVVLVHGLGARSRFGPIDYFHGLPGLLRNAGNEVFIASMTPFQTIEHRAEQLKSQIEKALPDAPKINIVAHSMGGLDARFLISALGFADRVASLTTIGTPHRGSVVSDIALGAVPDKAFGAVDKLLGYLDSSCGGFVQIGTRHCTEVFSKRAPDQEGVAYFSATSAIPDPVFRHALPVFWVPHRILKRYEGDNDGFVSVASAKWGEHICTYPGDHYGQIGQVLGRSRGLDYMAFYREILTRLNREGM